MSPQTASMAVKLGFKNVKVMLVGTPGWQKAGNPLVVNNKFVETGNIVLVDLRKEAEVAAGHIPRAVNIPMAALADAEEDFPANKSAPIVLCGDGDDPLKARKIIKGWGFKSVALMTDGLGGWQADGKELATGPAATEINWVRKLGKDEVSVADFEKAVSGTDSASVILDVRGPDETGGGMFPGSINIPLDALEKRIGELPKDKTILIHCSTGARAEMAFETLKSAKLNAKFLVADVTCEDGKCEIGE
ncbi:MAG: rhodanese [Proteobacteria bacterium]|nr:rhodanese [Pseudomonadota bacterium]MBU1736536.1 rhodanese [Pseudomonadota bacterium]